MKSLLVADQSRRDLGRGSVEPLLLRLVEELEQAALKAEGCGAAVCDFVTEGEIQGVMPQLRALDALLHDAVQLARLFSRMSGNAPAPRLPDTLRTHMQSDEEPRPAANTNDAVLPW